MWPDAPDWPPHRISILTLAVFSRHTCRHTCHFQHNHYSCPVLLEQCRALKSQARQQSPCLVRTESAALFSSDTDFSPSPTCAKGLRLTVPRSVPAGSRLVREFSLLWYLFCPCARAPIELHVMSSIQRTMRTCTRGASGAGVSVPAARGIPNSRAPSCHLERACRLRLAAGTRAAPQRSWHFLRTLSVSVIGDSSGAGMSLKPSVPGSGRLWDPPSHAGRPCGTPARACTASAWMDQIRGEAVRLMSSEGSAAVYILFVGGPSD